MTKRLKGPIGRALLSALEQAERSGKINIAPGDDIVSFLFRELAYAEGRRRTMKMDRGSEDKTSRGSKNNQRDSGGKR